MRQFEANIANSFKSVREDIENLRFEILELREQLGKTNKPVVKNSSSKKKK